MKKKLLVLSVLLITFGVGFFWKKSYQTNISQPSISPSSVLGEKVEPTQGEIASTISVTGDDISLIPNFKEQKTSEELFAENSCEYLVNGGFYTKEGKPVGLFKSGNTLIRNEHESELFDGYLTINDMATPRITRVIPKDSLAVALQSGPILIENGSPLTLSIRNDSTERRVVAIVSGDNKIRFILVQSVTLRNLPEMIFNWAQSQNIPIADAINLDGGTASAFRSKDVNFPEISPIGSAFCIK